MSEDGLLDRDWPLVDLFGDPVPLNRGRRGRPAHVPTAENRGFVTMLLAVGETPERIAAALDITMPTLRKHYFSELARIDVARTRAKGRMLVQLVEQAMKGNAGAAKQVIDQIDRADAKARAGVLENSKRPNPPPMGKKEKELAAAFKAGDGTSWDEILTTH